MIALGFVNTLKIYVQGKGLITTRATPAPGQLAEMAKPFKELL